MHSFLVYLWVKSQSVSVSLGSGNVSNSLRYMSNFQFFDNTLIIYIILCIFPHIQTSCADLEVAQTNLIHLPSSTLCYPHVKQHHNPPPPSLQKRRKLKRRQRQQGKKKKKIILVPHDSPAIGTRIKTPQKQSPTSHTRSQRKLPLPDLNC